MKRITCCLLAALLAACDTLPTRVDVPVPVQCHVTVPAEPAWATLSLAPGAGLYDKVKALLAERAQRIGYEIQLRAAAQACQ